MIGFKGTVSYGFYQSLFLNEFLNIFILNAIIFSTGGTVILARLARALALTPKVLGSNPKEVLF